MDMQLNAMLRYDIILCLLKILSDHCHVHFNHLACKHTVTLLQGRPICYSIRVYTIDSMAIITPTLAAYTEGNTRAHTHIRSHTPFLDAWQCRNTIVTAVESVHVVSGPLFVSGISVSDRAAAGRARCGSARVFISVPAGQLCASCVTRRIVCRASISCEVRTPGGCRLFATVRADWGSDGRADGRRRPR